MRYVLEPLIVANVALCIIILALGFLVYRKDKNKLALYVGIAFGLFALSHLIVIFGLAMFLAGFLIIFRVLAYFIVIFALSRSLIK